MFPPMHYNLYLPQITNLLEEEGIPWTEEGNGWTISIRVDAIDHNKLSFANQQPPEY